MGNSSSENNNSNNDNSITININVNPSRLFKAIVTQSHEVLPNITSIHIKNIEFDHGHPTIPGSTFKINFHDGSYVKIKVDNIDSENYVIKFTAYEGTTFGDKYDKIYSVTKFEESGDGGTIVKLSAEYHTKDNHEPTAAEITDATEKAEIFYKAVEEYLIAHPTIAA